MIRVEACRAADLFDAAGWDALLAEYAAECANPLLGKIAPRREMYEAMETSGFAQCFSGRVDGRLCGLAVLLMSSLPHYGARFASVESLFVMRDARRTAMGAQMLVAVEAHAREAGCAGILYSAPVGGSMDRLLFLRGEQYERTNHVYTRRLV